MANLHPAWHPFISLNITVDTRHIQYRYFTNAKPAEKLDIEDIANEEQQMGELTNL